MRRAVFVALLSFSVFVRASTLTTDISGMWWNPAESGWGVNVTLQNDIAFLTFYLYSPGRAPVWYSANATYRGTVGAGDLLWDGPLFETAGPWFGGFYNQATVTTRQVGLISFRLGTITQATLSYSVDGVSVTRSIERFTFRNEDYSGFYAGGYSLRFYNCSPSSLNGIQEKVGFIQVTHNGGAFSASITGTNPTCSFSGAYTQSGQVGAVGGDYTCSDGARGTFNLYEITATISGFNGRMEGVNQYCDWSGYFGGIKRAQ